MLKKKNISLLLKLEEKHKKSEKRHLKLFHHLKNKNHQTCENV
jgi:hypothetical protein